MQQSHSGLASYQTILQCIYIYTHTQKSCLWKAQCRTMKIQEFYMKSLDQVCGSLLMEEKLPFTLLKDTILLLGQGKTLRRVPWWGRETKICALIFLKLLLGFSFLHTKQKQTIWKNLCKNLGAFPMSNITRGRGSLVPYQEVFPLNVTTAVLDNRQRLC